MTRPNSQVAALAAPVSAQSRHTVPPPLVDFYIVCQQYLFVLNCLLVCFLFIYFISDFSKKKKSK